MDLQGEENNEEQTTRSFTKALKEKYCMPDDEDFNSFRNFSVFSSPKSKARGKNSTAELGHLRTIVLNSMNVMTADIPQRGLTWLCPNVVDLDLTNNLLDKWSELLAILAHLPHLKFVNASGNSLNVDTEYDDRLPKTPLNVENLALNGTGIAIEDIIHISQIMPVLKELHLCDNDYEHLGPIDERIKSGTFSSLECLRLNNNKIQNWTEVWKLRDLQCLKDLILSGNPVIDVFYRKTEDTKEPWDTKDFKPQEGKSPEDYLEDSSGVCPILDNMDFQGFRNDNESGSYVSECFDHVMECLKNACEKVETKRSLQKKNRFYHETDEIDRPVSRIGRHEDSDPEDQDNEYSDEENIFILNITEDEQNDKSFNSCQWLDGSKGSNDSFNTNSSIVAVTDDDSFIDTNAGTDMSDTDMSKDSENSFLQSHYTWIAESFLSDILDNIDFKSSPSSSLSGVLSGYSTPVVTQGDNQESNSSTVPLFTKDSDNEVENISNAGDSSNKSQDGIFSISRHMNDNAGMSPCCTCNFSEATAHERSENSKRDSPDLCIRTQIYDKESENDWMTKLKDGTLICNRCQSCVVEENDLKQKIESYHKVGKCCVLNEEGVDSFDPNRVRQFQAMSNNSNMDVCAEKLNWGSCNNNSLNCEDEITTQSNRDESSLERVSNRIPFENLEGLCLSNAGISHWKALDVFSSFPKLTRLRLQCNPLYSSVQQEDRRKLYIASLPNVKSLNGGQVTDTEREKAEHHYLRHFMEEEEKPDVYHSLVDKHGEPVQLVDIDLSAGYQEWALLDFICDGERKFSRKVHLTEQVGKLRILVSEALTIPRKCFIMHYNPCSPIHPEDERDRTELRCESLPMSRFNFADGDEIHIEIVDP